MCAIDVDRGELKDSLPKGTAWEGSDAAGTDELAFIGIFDG